MIQGLLIIALLAGMLLFPSVAAAQNEPMAYKEEPIIAPSVVRQGDFALRLARALNLPTSEDEEEAARALAALGIQPAGGWKADQPVTPQVVAELRNAVVAAAKSGRLVMGLDAAMRAFTDLVAEFGLPLPTEPAPGYASGGAPATAYGPYCDGGALEYYYGSFGAPIYSYCPPPPAYYYMYYWVPYGFYWHQHVFTGFFIRKHFDGIPRTRHRDHRHRFTDGHDGKKHDRDQFHRWRPQASADPIGVGKQGIPQSPPQASGASPPKTTVKAGAVPSAAAPGVEIIRFAPSHRIRTGERPAASAAHPHSGITAPAHASSTANSDGTVKRVAPVPTQTPSIVVPSEQRRIMNRATSDWGSSDSRVGTRWRLGPGQ